MNLKFPELRGGPVQGLNDAGVENFQGAIDSHLARECAQNSLDAARPGITKVFLKFECLAIKAKDIPGFIGLRQTLKACLARWGDKPKEKEYFENAMKLANQDEIPVLRIGDQASDRSW
jgi:hypothetical protein